MKIFLNFQGLPWIDKAASPNVTALLGKTAYLNCRVKNLADKTVSKRYFSRIYSVYDIIFDNF